MFENSEVSQIINQVKSETRNENFKKFFIKNSKILIALAAIVVILAIGYFIFDSYQKSKEEKFSIILHQSLVDQQLGDLDKVKESLEQITTSSAAPKNIQALANLRYASIFLEEGDNQTAIAAYEKVNQCQTCDAYIKDLGGLLMVKVWLSDDSEIAKTDLAARIENIESNSKELKYHISEQRALLEMQKGNLEAAYVIFDSLAKNPEADQALKARAKESLKIVGFKPAAS